MKITANVELEDIYAGDEWDETIGGVIRECLVNEVKRQVKANLKADAELAALIKKHGEALVTELLKKG